MHRNISVTGVYLHCKRHHHIAAHTFEHHQWQALWYATASGHECQGESASVLCQTGLGAHIQKVFAVYGQQRPKCMLEVCTQLVGAVQVHLDDVRNAGPGGLVAGVLGINGGHALLLPRIGDLRQTQVYNTELLLQLLSHLRFGLLSMMLGYAA